MNFVLCHPKLEETIRQLRKQSKVRSTQSKIMVENINKVRDNRNEINPKLGNNRRTYITPNIEGCSNSIVKPPIQVNSFEIKLSMLH